MFLASCERVRPARNGPRPTHPGTQGSGPCVQRESQLDAIIVIVIEKRQREMKRDRQREEKEREMKRDRDRDEQT